VSKSRQVLLVKILQVDDDDETAGAGALNSIPLGTHDSIIEQLREFNTGPDGSNSPETYGVLYGPGMIMQLPMVGGDDPVMQLAVSMHEEDLAWPVLMRICRRLGWKMMDPATGRTFGGM